MVFEIAQIVVKDGMNDRFEAAVREAAPYFQHSEGCTSLRLERVVEAPDTYHLVVGWNSVEDHMVTFRASEGFTRWRELASPFFAKPPLVQHMETVFEGF
jgi:quinol monooxygenase YgiN